MPELITYYLGERPALESVPDLPDRRRGRARGSSLERVGELVTKPVDGYGGAGVLIGPAATAAEVAAAARRDRRRPGRLGGPGGRRAVVPPLPWTAGGCEPRRVDLRAFVYLTGTRPRGLPGSPPSP